MKSRLFQESDGFTLVEILIATVIITIISLGVATLTIGIIRGNSFNKRLTTATTLIQDRLEGLRRVGYSNIPIGDSTEDYGSIANFSGYKRYVSVKYLKDDPATKIKILVVKVYWGAVKNSQASTILAE